MGLSFRWHPTALNEQRAFLEPTSCRLLRLCWIRIIRMWKNVARTAATVGHCFAKSLSLFSKLVCYWALLRWHFHCSRGRSFQWQGGLVTLPCPPLFGTKEDSWWIWWMSYSETTGYVCCCDGHHFINDLSIWIQDMFETYLNSGRANRIAVGTVSKMLALCLFHTEKAR